MTAHGKVELPRDDDAAIELVVQRDNERTARVTVAISLYNYRDRIVGCLDSVKAQTARDIELVVVDDDSHDDGCDVVRRWLEATGERFGRYMLLRHRSNRGLAAARNTAFAQARAPYVFVLDADNTIYSRCVQQLAGSLERCGASFAYCYVERFGDAVGLHNVRAWNPKTLRFGNTIDAMVLLRKTVWEAVGGYSTDMPVMGWEDFDLWFKIARLGGWGVQIPEILARYDVHSDSMITTVTNPAADRLWAHLRATYPEFFSRVHSA